MIDRCIRCGKIIHKGALCYPCIQLLREFVESWPKEELPVPDMKTVLQRCVKTLDTIRTLA